MTFGNNLVIDILMGFFLLYGLGVLITYAWIAVYALGAVKHYKKGNTLTDYGLLASNTDAPRFSLLAPAYNEGMTVVENVRSLLSLYYPNLEIIIINDGSKDDSISRLVEAYHLEKVPYFVENKIATKEIRAIYKSSNPAFKRLVVVDKENGGKADALNVGINVSTGEYLVCIDVDCILEQDAILKLSKPFMDTTDKRVIACGGVIRLANNCTIKDGKVVEVKMPRSWLARVQVLEYIRAFILGRMAWSRASGLILISGAFGVFDKKIVLACGGYDSSTVGEDMELVVRMRRYMEEKELPYDVVSIPDPLCWTEAPESKDILMRQRNRWMRGTMETLWSHRKMIFNKKYGKMGMLSLPYWFLFEFLGPLVEFTGYVLFFVFLLLGVIDWQIFLVLLSLVLSVGFLFSIYAILVDLTSYQVYSNRKDFRLLVLTALIEPFYFHPKVVWASVLGFKDYFKKNHSWGVMTRQGFSQNTTKNTTTARSWKHALYFSSAAALIYIVLASILGIVEVIIAHSERPFTDIFGTTITLLTNVARTSVLVATVGMALGFVIILIHRKSGELFAIVYVMLMLILQLICLIYFQESHNLLGADLWHYNLQDVQTTLQAAGVLKANYFVIGFIVLYLLYQVLKKWTLRLKSNEWIAFSITVVALLSVLLPQATFASKAVTYHEQNTSTSKLGYFIKQNWEELISSTQSTQPLKKVSNFDSNYPFLKERTSTNFFDKYFTSTKQKPHVVLIIVEGLGKAYSDSNGYIGSFTPFLQSLKPKSLVWDHMYSSSGRTFEVLPALLGSLPTAKNGFLELGEYPEHFNLANIFIKNGYRANYYYGGDADFDNMSKYLLASSIKIKDLRDFPKTYRKLPSNSGESWGYEDQAVFSELLVDLSKTQQPMLATMMTLSAHSPFKVNDQDYFSKETQKIISELPDSKKKIASTYKNELAAVVNSDYAIKNFFTEARKFPFFENTIFIITGDHSIPEIELESRASRYQVPFLVYSPLLTQSDRFEAIVSHYDVAPFITTVFENLYGLKVPAKTSWLGTGLQPDLRTSRYIPLMQSKFLSDEYIYGDVYTSPQGQYRLPNLSPVSDPLIKKASKQAHKEYIEKNSLFLQSRKLLPDSTFNNYIKRKDF